MKAKSIIAGAFATAILASCVTNPITGRKTIQLVGNDQIEAMALQEYRKALSTGQVVTSGAAAQQVKNVGTRIARAATNYYKSIGRESDIANYQWEFNLLEDKQMNAWCMPGGKVAVYSGILPVTTNDTGLAVVLGHEISHALAGHGNERISQAMIAQYGGQIVGGTLGNSQAAQVFSQVYPIGAQITLLKYGRNQELEADQMGLDIMGMAGYDPRQAIPFWERMERVSNGQRSPEFLSTHPNPGNRVNNLGKEMPRALQYYKTAGGKI